MTGTVPVPFEMTLRTGFVVLALLEGSSKDVERSARSGDGLVRGSPNE